MTGNGDVIMRLMSVLSPPVRALSSDSGSEDSISQSVSPVLVDLQSYQSRASSLLVAVWRWSWNSKKGYGPKSISKKYLSSYHIPLANDSVNCVDQSCMTILDVSSVGANDLLRLSQEDLTVCNFILSEREVEGSDGQDRREQKLQVNVFFDYKNLHYTH